MAVTLTDYFRQAKSAEHKGFIADLLRYSPIMGELPFVGTPGLQVSGIRWLTLPSVAFRALNTGYTEGTGRTENVKETLAVLGGDVKIDRILTIAKNVYEDPLTTQLKMKSKALAFAFNDYFFNGSVATDPDSFDGLAVRISNMPSRQTINLASGGDSLKVLASTANTHTFLDALDQAIEYCEGATHCFGNLDTRLKFAGAIRRASPALFSTAKDAYDREILTYKGVRLMDAGLKADKTTEIITSTQDPGDGGNDATSLYFARIDTDDGLHGLELEGTSPNPYDPLEGGELESGPQYLRRIDWAIGLFNLSNYAMVRVKGFRMAAS